MADCLAIGKASTYMLPGHHYSLKFNKENACSMLSRQQGASVGSEVNCK